MTVLYACWIGALLGIAAQAGERALRAVGRPGRWAWLAALGLTSTAPWIARAGVSAIRLPVTVTENAAAAQASLIPMGLLLWALLSAVLLAAFGVEAWRMRRALRGWPRARVSGVSVRVTPDIGPATLGVLRPVIALPAWVLSLPVRERRLVLLHELEHARAGDVRLLAVAAALVVLMPWNPALWWQAARLHRAVELDCDARVVRRSRDVRRYARLLVDAAAGGLRAPKLAVGMGRSPLIEQRVSALIRARRASPVGALFAVAGAAACAVATPAPAPPVVEFHAVELPMSIYEMAPQAGASEGGSGEPRGIPAPPAGVVRPMGRATYEAREVPLAESPMQGGVIRRRR